MKILYLSPKIDVENVKGLARYSYEIIKRVEKKYCIDVIERKSEIDILIPQLKTIGKNYDIIHALSQELACFLPFIKTKAKKVVSFHDFFPLYAKELKYKFGRFFYLTAKLIWKLSLLNDVIIANSSLTKNELVKHFNVSPNRIKVILEGIDKKFRPIKIKKEKITIGFFGNFSYRKRVDIALKIFKELENKIDANFILAGGKLKSFYQRNFDVEKLIKILNLKNVKIIEKVKEDEIVKFYNSLDFLIFPSMIEGFGLPILEAQACNCIVLINKSSLIPKEVSKYALKFENERDAAKIILELIENKEKMNEIKRKARKYAKSFKWENTVKKLINIYENL